MFAGGKNHAVKLKIKELKIEMSIKNLGEQGCCGNRLLKNVFLYSDSNWLKDAVRGGKICECSSV